MIRFVFDRIEVVEFEMILENRFYVVRFVNMKIVKLGIECLVLRNLLMVM